MTENEKVIKRPILITGAILCLLNLVFGALAYPHLPEKVPTHWNLAGEVDGWGSAFQGAFMIPLIMLGVGALFVIVGNYMGKLKHNYFAGIRTPWTLASEEVWRKTHRMAGPIWVLGGILLMAASFLPSQYTPVAILVLVFCLGIIPAVYSFVIFKKLEKEE